MSGGLCNETAAGEDINMDLAMQGDVNFNTVPLRMVATVIHHAGLVALLICNSVRHHTGLAANCHTLFQ